ncbi:bis(5'-nucleosyl)-tetraphosphatase (symmetrical) YqeK [Oscillospiraceae bacterium OttesenSCG-928-G22]|nr:bis(5'-nucleosyl)-tetraphosphatase (symmetrical) YqeK [Oscillospiraceae bacterium OttesenSCG-928-G22]
MNSTTLEAVKEKALSMVSARRRAHVLGCAVAAKALAERYGYAPELAYLSGLLHDITKEFDRDGQLKLCKQYGIIPSPVEEREWKLLHAKTGAAVAADVFGAPADVVQAIRYHTTGRSGMTLPEKILYLADYIEETRNFPGVEHVREVAFFDIDRALLRGFELTIREILDRGGLISVDTVDAYNDLQMAPLHLPNAD